jgi:hypothetical protein
LTLAVGTLGTPLVMAEEPLTKEQIVNRSAKICSDITEAVEPHLERANQAAEQKNIDRFIRESRRAILSARSYVGDLKDLRPPTGARKYRRFVRQGELALDWLDAALDALEAGHVNRAESRRDTALEHLMRAKRAARRYGLRRPCIRVVS